jgi:hypothetical protein
MIQANPSSVMQNLFSKNSKKNRRNNRAFLKGDTVRWKSSYVKALLCRIAIVVLAWIVTGCGSKSGKLPDYMRPELLYLNHRLYSRLYVEVDTVEGVDVPDKWVDELKDYLETYCSKPDGIKIIRDTPIPISEVKGLPIGAASILCLDGPDPNSDPQSAYLHVFFYDRSIGAKGVTRAPYVSGYCPTTILFNVSYFQVSKGKAEEFALKHELGHVLGLCKNPDHCDGAHCRDHECRMYKSPGLLPTFGLLFGSRVEKQLCAECQKDLERMTSEDVDPKVSFKGPFLIRREEGYSVASLPYCHVIMSTHVESTFDWMDLVSLLKDMTRKDLTTSMSKIQKARKRNWHLKWSIRGYWDGSNDKDVPSKDPTEDEIAILKKATHDPCPPVKRHAIAALKKLEQEQQQ